MEFSENVVPFSLLIPVALSDLADLFVEEHYKKDTLIYRQEEIKMKGIDLTRDLSHFFMIVHTTGDCQSPWAYVSDKEVFLYC